MSFCVKMLSNCICVIRNVSVKPSILVLPQDGALFFLPRGHCFTALFAWWVWSLPSLGFRMRGAVKSSSNVAKASSSRSSNFNCFVKCPDQEIIRTYFLLFISRPFKPAQMNAFSYLLLERTTTVQGSM